MASRDGAHEYAIPVRTNLAITGVCSILYFVLLYAGSHADTIWETIGYGVRVRPGPDTRLFADS